ncbi:hypothetical protein ACLOJK_016502 [Asimina triloba]
MPPRAPHSRLRHLDTRQKPRGNFSFSAGTDIWWWAAIQANSMVSVRDVHAQPENVLYGRSRVCVICAVSLLVAARKPAMEGSDDLGYNEN